jgi:hypothetical protein
MDITNRNLTTIPCTDPRTAPDTEAPSPSAEARASQPALGSSARTAKQERTLRKAQALRDNLRRRKEFSRSQPSTATGGEG